MNKIELPFERECTRKDSDYHKKCLHYDEENGACAYLRAPWFSFCADCKYTQEELYQVRKFLEEVEKSFMKKKVYVREDGVVCS